MSTQATQPGRWAWFLAIGLSCYVVTNVLVILGVVLGRDFFQPLSRTGPDDPIRLFARWDGDWFADIVAEGYSYVPGTQSRVGFFPAYPLLGKAVVWLTGVRPHTALVIVSHLCLAVTFVLAAAYVHGRAGNAAGPLVGYTVIAMGLLPNTYILRMAYSEALFLLLTVLVLYAIERSWPLLVIALLVGTATANRPVGVGLLVPFLLHLWHRSPTAWPFVRRAGVFVPVACWGILTYMAYQFVAFDEPLGFVKSQANWRLRAPVPFEDKLKNLEMLEPVWSLFTPSSPGFWGHREPNRHPLFSLGVANAVFFLLAIALTGVGRYKRWLSPYELAATVPLLVIPYLTRGHDFLAGAGRFSAVVFPVYLVVAHLLCRASPPLVAGFVGLSGFFLAVYAAVFAWTPVYPLI